MSTPIIDVDAIFSNPEVQHFSNTKPTQKSKPVEYVSNSKKPKTADNDTLDSLTRAFLHQLVSDYMHPFQSLGRSLQLSLEEKKSEIASLNYRIQQLEAYMKKTADSVNEIIIDITKLIPAVDHLNDSDKSTSKDITSLVSKGNELYELVKQNEKSAVERLTQMQDTLEALKTAHESLENQLSLLRYDAVVEVVRDSLSPVPNSEVVVEPSHLQSHFEQQDEQSDIKQLFVQWLKDNGYVGRSHLYSSFLNEARDFLERNGVTLKSLVATYRHLCSMFPDMIKQQIVKKKKYIVVSETIISV